MDADAAAALERAMTTIAAASPSGFVTEVAPGVTAYATGVPMARMNGIVLTRPDALVDVAWRAARTRLTAAGVPWTAQLVGPGATTGTDSIGAAAEAGLGDREPVVTWVLEPATGVTAVADVEVVPVVSTADREGFSRVLGAAFGSGPEIGRPLVEAAERDPRIRAVVVRGRRDDGVEDVLATGYSVLEGPVVGVFAIATAAQARRRGLGEAVTRAVIADGVARGATVAVLQASAAGRPLYERLGFRDAGDDIVYRRAR